MPPPSIWNDEKYIDEHIALPNLYKLEQDPI